MDARSAQPDANPPALSIRQFNLHPYQRRAIESPHRFGWFCWARQVGKSYGIGLRRLLRGIVRKRDQLFLSASERQSRELMAKTAEHLKRLERGFELSEREELLGDVRYNQLEIRVSGGPRIIGLPANPVSVRGFTGDVLLDEFALHKDDREIWAAMYPTLTRAKGELDVCSTPKGRQNLFYAVRENAVFHHDTVTIDDAIAEGLDVDREELRQGLGDNELWRQEFLCEFLDELTAFLTFEMIQECEDATLPRELDVHTLAEHKGDVVIGVDIGRKHDLTVIWAFQVIGSQLISLGLIELAATRFQTQFELLCDVLSSPCVRRCCIDASGLGMQLAEQLQDRFGSYKVEACTFTAPFKSEIGGGLRVKLEDKNIRFPVCPDIRNDLHSVRKTVTTAGNIRLDAPREDGSHADRFYAAALAVHAATAATAKIEVCVSRRRLHGAEMRRLT